MHLLYIQSSPRGRRSVSIAVTDAFLQAYRQACPELTVDTLNVWEEDLPDFDHAADLPDAQQQQQNQGQHGRELHGRHPGPAPLPRVSG